MATQIRLEPVLFTLSLLLAFGTRYVMLEALSHLLSGANRKRLPWFVISVLATGGGIWMAVMTCLQAIDPQTLNLPHQPLMTSDILAQYGLGDVIVSLVVAFTLAWCFVLSVEKGGSARWGVHLSSIAIVATQTATQLTCLLALHYPHTLTHRWEPFIALKLFNLLVNGLALHLFIRKKQEVAPWERNKLLAAALMGTAAATSDTLLISTSTFSFVPTAPYPGELVVGVTDVWAATFASTTLLLLFLVLVHSHHESVREVQLSVMAL